MIESHAETKQLHSTRLTHGSIAQRYFWEGGQDRFPALSSSPHSTYCRWGFIWGACGCQSMSSTSACSDRLSRTTRQSWMEILEIYYTNGIQHSYRGHYYILQNVPLMKAVQVTFYKMEHSSPVMGDPGPTVNRHTTTAFAGRRILTVVTLPPRSVNWNRLFICRVKCRIIREYDSIPRAKCIALIVVFISV